MIYIKLHVAQDKLLVAMCDQALIGKVLEEGDIVIDLKSYSEFYKGELTEPEAAASKVDTSKVYSSNVVGEEATKAAISMGLIEASNVKSVMGVPFAQSFMMDR